MSNPQISAKKRAMNDLLTCTDLQVQIELQISIEAYSVARVLASELWSRVSMLHDTLDSAEQTGD